MSYILEALKRADAERDRGAVPTLHSHAMPPPATAPARTPVATWIATFAVLALVAGAASWWTLGRQPAMVVLAPAVPPGTPAVPPAAAVAPTAPTVTAPAEPVRPPVPTPASTPAAAKRPAAAPTAAGSTNATTAATAAASPNAGTPPGARAVTRKTNEAERPPATGGRKADAAAAPGTVMPNRNPTGIGIGNDADARGNAGDGRNAANAPRSTGVATAATGAAPAGRGATAGTASTAIGANTASGTPAGAPASQGVIYSVAELPDDIRSQLPKLNISGATYSAQAAYRMLIVNGQVLHEKDEPAPGLTVDTIRQNDVVLRFKGYRYSVGY